MFKAILTNLTPLLKSVPKDPSRVLDGSNKLVATITKGTSTVNGSSKLTLSDATSRLGPVK